MGVKMGWIQIKMGNPLARNGAALAPFRANRAHPSNVHASVLLHCILLLLTHWACALSALVVSKWTRTRKKTRSTRTDTTMEGE